VAAKTNRLTLGSPPDRQRKTVVRLIAPDEAKWDNGDEENGVQRNHRDLIARVVREERERAAVEREAVVGQATAAAADGANACNNQERAGGCRAAEW
jgi:hypothetical protein